MSNWDKTTIPMYYRPGGAPGLVENTPDFEEMLHQAKSLWEFYTDFSIDYRGHSEDYTQDGSIVVSWYGLPEGVEGQARYWYGDDEQKTLGKVAVLLDPEKHDLRREKLMDVLIHELGHAIGIAEHSDDENSIMYPSFRKRHARVTSGDLAQVKDAVRTYPCRPMLLRDKSLFFPAVWGGSQTVEAWLPYRSWRDSQGWLFHEENMEHSSESCGPLPSKGGNLVLERIWSIDSQWYAEIEPPDNTTLVLRYAEEIKT